MIRAVIFDFNGVLVDDEHLHFAMFQEVLAEEGVDITEDDYHHKYLGLDDRGCFAAALDDGGQTSNEPRLDDLIARKAVRYAANAAKELNFFAEAAQTLERLGSVFPIAINSGALRPEIEFALGLIDRRRFVREIVSAEEVEHCKPHPQGYQMALEVLRREPGFGDLAPHECVVFEDSLAGVISAKGAGMHAVGVSNTYPTDELRASGADAVIDGLVGIDPAWIARTFNGALNHVV